MTSTLTPSKVDARAGGAAAAAGQSPDAAKSLLDASAWPAPKWCTQEDPVRVRRYSDYLIDRLRARYVALEGDFRTAFGNFFDDGDFDSVTAANIAQLLHQARAALEGRRPDVVAVATELDLAERYMIWVYPPEIAALEVPSLRLKLASLPADAQALYTTQLAGLFDEQGSLIAAKANQLRSVYDEIIGAYNEAMLQRQLDTRLQIARLKRLFFWGCPLLVLLLLAAPLTTRIRGQQWFAWPYGLGDIPQFVTDAWLSSLSIALLGATGGFLSGLLQARNSGITLAEYQDSMLKLRLRPVVGALVSLIIYALLSWGAITGITVSSFGALLLLAFVSGFSERYFLRLVKLDSTDASAGATADGGGSAAQPVATK